MISPKTPHARHTNPVCPRCTDAPGIPIARREAPWRLTWAFLGRRPSRILTWIPQRTVMSTLAWRSKRCSTIDTGHPGASTPGDGVRGRGMTIAVVKGDHRSHDRAGVRQMGR